MTKKVTNEQLKQMYRDGEIDKEQYRSAIKNKELLKPVQNNNDNDIILKIIPEIKEISKAISDSNSSLVKQQLITNKYIIDSVKQISKKVSKLPESIIVQKNNNKKWRVKVRRDQYNTINQLDVEAI